MLVLSIDVLKNTLHSAAAEEIKKITLHVWTPEELIM